MNLFYDDSPSVDWNVITVAYPDVNFGFWEEHFLRWTENVNLNNWSRPTKKFEVEIPLNDNEKKLLTVRVSLIRRSIGLAPQWVFEIMDSLLVMDGDVLKQRHGKRETLSLMNVPLHLPNEQPELLLKNLARANLEFFCRFFYCVCLKTGSDYHPCLIEYDNRRVIGNCLEYKHRAAAIDAHNFSSDDEDNHGWW